LLPALAAAKRHAQVVQAKLQISDIVTAIQHYDSDNGRFPVSKNVQTNSPNDFTFGGVFKTDSGTWQVGQSMSGVVLSNAEVISILMDLTNYPGGGWTANVNHQYNPKQIGYLNAKMTGDLETWPGVGSDLVYRDPWGNPYVISMDLNYDEQCQDAFYSLDKVSHGGLNGLANPDGTAATTDKWLYHGKVMIWSAGPNGKIDPGELTTDKENRDNVLSWK
jgi:type II secretory pathway pseudopilin PulG